MKTDFEKLIQDISKAIKEINDLPTTEPPPDEFWSRVNGLRQSAYDLLHALNSYIDG